MRGQRGTTLAEMMVACALFTVFMMVSVGLFTSMTHVARDEQKPTEAMAEGRTAALILARRIRNCRAFVRPALWQVLRAPTDRLMIRDQVLNKTVEFRLSDGVLVESYYPIDYNPDKPGVTLPEKGMRLTPASSFQVVGGGVAHPTRITVEIVLADGRTVRSTSNFREAI